MAQAKLYLYLRSYLASLREVGVRTVLDFKGGGQNPRHLQAIADSQPELSLLSLELAHQSLSEDPSVAELEELARNLAESSGVVSSPA